MHDKKIEIIMKLDVQLTPILCSDHTSVHKQEDTVAYEITSW